ncbi:MAG: hypothetical protein GWN99_00630 [Gemmatimonadetes bacterium]|uniref:Uncharacterized protein n=1 Tax=Candidatus Kutchimonas denitrificans TaxID=3056748 RepID=A0AAE4Z4Y7_9BACT|nr:hypothetical protein [Gemmatimonadota bacterium]NIR73613.1 hypothetical protein [Candidatus Kutchimonas denitrificans]NIR99572.1 hypothetical protein [Gemmatimonadota bacterium]NIT65192.1 hypothetical protein [Gemmatimonadota bacterium]NIV23725.1 hypothetical protein [Gemmatimonadota bacterium]
MSGSEPRPAEICRQLIAALAGSEGRRRRRKRDTRPDAVGITVKRRIMEAAVRADPGPDEFEAWLLARTSETAWLGELDAQLSSGAVRAMALDVLAEWRYALATPSFREWLREGAPSADAETSGGAADRAPGTA